MRVTFVHCDLCHKQGSDVEDFIIGPVTAYSSDLLPEVGAVTIEEVCPQCVEELYQAQRVAAQAIRVRNGLEPLTKLMPVEK